MRVLIDSHTLIWAVDDPSRLGKAAANSLQDPANELLLGAGSVWELAIKVGLKKLTLSIAFKQWMNKAISDLNLSVLRFRLIMPTFRRVCRRTIAIHSTVCWSHSAWWRMFQS